MGSRSKGCDSCVVGRLIEEVDVDVGSDSRHDGIGACYEPTIVGNGLAKQLEETLRAGCLARGAEEVSESAKDSHERLLPNYEQLAEELPVVDNSVDLY